MDESGIPQGLDPTAFILTKAIGRSEASGSSAYQKEGDNGTSFGRYQILKKNWPSWAAKYLGDPNAPTSEENQNKVAYSRVKEMLDGGLTQAQVASMWNSGHPDKNTVGKGFNANLGVSYDVPGYVDRVKKNYQQVQEELSKGYNPSPYSSPDTPTQTPPVSSQQPQEQTLGQELSGRLTQGSQALQRAASGQINPISGILQTVGAGAGAVNDVVQRGLELIPGFKKVENLIGSGVGSLASTSIGQSVGGAIKSFAQAHPELADDIGAGFNIATAIPIFEGLSAVKGVAGDVLSNALQDVAKKSVVEGVTDSMGTGKILSRAFLRNGGKDTVQNAIEVMGKEAVPAIENGKYVTEDAFNKVGDAISKIENEELQPELQKASTTAVADRVPLEDLRKQALDEIEKEFKASGSVGKGKAEVNRVFDDYKNSYGDYVTLQDMNDMKRGIRTTVNFNSPKLESDVTYHIGQTFQKGIEDSANKLGLKNIQAINQKMANLIKYQDMLKALNKTSVKQGLLRRLVQRTSGGVAGGFIGNKIGGIPGEIAGGYIGERVAGSLGKKNVGGLVGKLLK